MDILQKIYWRLLWRVHKKETVQNCRSRLGERGLACFKLLVRDTRRDLTRSVARLPVENSLEATRLCKKYFALQSNQLYFEV